MDGWEKIEGKTGWSPAGASQGETRGRPRENVWTRCIRVHHTRRWTATRKRMHETVQRQDRGGEAIHPNPNQHARLGVRVDPRPRGVKKGPYADRRTLPPHVASKQGWSFLSNSSFALERKSETSVRKLPRPVVVVRKPHSVLFIHTHEWDKCGTAVVVSSLFLTRKLNLTDNHTKRSCRETKN